MELLVGTSLINWQTLYNSVISVDLIRIAVTGYLPLKQGACQRTAQGWSTKGVTLPATLPASKQKEVDRFDKLAGAAFDNAYIGHMVSDHKKDVAEFQKESKRGKDTDVKAFATNTLPTLQDHLKMVQDISSKLHPRTASHTTKTTTRKSGK